MFILRVEFQLIEHVLRMNGLRDFLTIRDHGKLACLAWICGARFRLFYRPLFELSWDVRIVIRVVLIGFGSPASRR